MQPQALHGVQTGSSAEAEGEGRGAVMCKVGDSVRFAHQHPDGPVHAVTAVFSGRDPMVEISGMVGRFGAHIFIAAEPSNHDDVQDAAAGEK
jgi:hypothetical protein